MQTVASLQTNEADELVQRLKKQGIPAELRTVTQETGMTLSEILVEDGYFDQACDVAESWADERVEEGIRKSGKHCPQCRSVRLDYAPHDKLGTVYKCKDCGFEYL